MVKGCCCPSLKIGTLLLCVTMECVISNQSRLQVFRQKKTGCHKDNLTLNVDHSQHIKKKTYSLNG